ncbi:malate dehydrogenase [Botryosphaeria dothidea]|uniref:Malate dehydrogenase n=1 Tax=Botryosphaeria dothidea TaxID=55169 RepID=A0A8H4N7P3_9PEZI|nr:malate dehydrogenase [Botryosphaeria dothidea]KAF4305712.1 malate dehydrogenase [Botryosphaeria dothidea]
MHFSPAVALLVALTPSCLLAAPTRTTLQDVQRRDDSDSNDDASSSNYLISSISNVWRQAGSCDLSSVTLPLDQAPNPTPLPGPSSGLVLSHVAVGRGTQNYTCAGASPSSSPTAKGAVATLFNATCQAARTPDLLYQTPSIALAYDTPSAESALQAYDMLLSGHHYFTSDTTPFFNLDTAEHSYGTVACKKDAAANAPSANSTSALKSNYAAGTEGTSNGDVPWLKLAAVQDESGYTWKEVYRLNTAGGQSPKTCDGIDGDFTVEYAATYWFYTEPGKDAYLNGAVAGTPDGMDKN